MADVYAATQTGETAGILKRISWGALFAGIVVTIVIQFWLSLLGFGIGFATINPTSEQNPFGGLGMGGVIWFGIISLISVFVGSWITARMAGSRRGLNGILHSIVVWASVVLFSIFVTTSAIGYMMSGVAGVVSKGLSAAGQAASSSAPVVQKMLEERGISVDSMTNEALKMFGVGEAQKGEQRNELRQAVQNIVTSGKAHVSTVDRTKIVNALVSQSNMSRAEAEKTVDSWIRKYQQTMQNAEQTKQQALQIAERASGTISAAAIGLWILMLLSAGAAAWGGWLGSYRFSQIET